MADPSAPSTLVIDEVTILSLLAALLTLLVAYGISLRALPSNSSIKLRVLFVWHLFDALIHFIFEGSFLYNCFFTFRLLPSGSSDDAISLSAGHEFTPPGVFFLGRKDRTYGSFYGMGPTAKLWQEYAKADKRWGGADLTVISLELLTVFGDGPMAAYVCWLLTKEAKQGKLWFWATVLATAELYGGMLCGPRSIQIQADLCSSLRYFRILMNNTDGQTGFMTFAPEWMTGNPNLDTSNFMYLWVYLFFFNTLWVWLPLFVLYEAYNNMQTAFAQSSLTTVTSAKKHA